MSSSKEYKKLYLVSPNTFEKLSKKALLHPATNHTLSHTSPSPSSSSSSSSSSSLTESTPSSLLASSSAAAKTKKFQEEYQKWLNKRNKLAIHSIRKRRVHDGVSPIVRKLLDKRESQKAADQEKAVFIGTEIPQPPVKAVPLRSKPSKGRIGQRNVQAQQVAASQHQQRPIKLYVRDRVSSEHPLPLKYVPPHIYMTPGELAKREEAQKDALLYGEDYLTDDESLKEEAAEEEEDDEEFYDMTDDTSVLPPEFGAGAAAAAAGKKSLQHLVSPLFMPEPGNYSTPLPVPVSSSSLLSLKKLKDRKATPYSALKNLKLTSPAATPLFTTKNKRSRIKFDTPEPMDTIPVHSRDLGDDKWFNRLLGRRHIKALDWSSFD